MWIITNQGFFSVVAKDFDGKPSAPGPDGVLSVRFRRNEDALRLFPNHELIATPGGDYACRVFATRTEVAQLLVNNIDGLDYGNFKNSIPKADRPLYDACNAAWGVFGRLQPGGPYGQFSRYSHHSAMDEFDADFEARTGYHSDLYSSRYSGSHKSLHDIVADAVAVPAKPKKKAAKRKAKAPRGTICAVCGVSGRVINDNGECPKCEA